MPCGDRGEHGLAAVTSNRRTVVPQNAHRHNLLLTCVDMYTYAHHCTSPQSAAVYLPLPPGQRLPGHAVRRAAHGGADGGRGEGSGWVYLRATVWSEQREASE